MSRRKLRIWIAHEDHAAVLGVDDFLEKS